MGRTDQLMTNAASWHSFLALPSKKAWTRKPRPCKHFHSKAGDGIRTHDVQLGNQSGACVSGQYKNTYSKPTDAPAHSPDSCGAMAFDDSELRSVVAAWPTLPEPIRRAVLALVGTVASSTTTKTPGDVHGEAGFGGGVTGGGQ